MTVIDFEAKKDERTERESAADELAWEDLRDRIIVAMATTPTPTISDTALISATLRALVDVLLSTGMTLEDAKVRIGGSLRCFF